MKRTVYARGGRGRFHTWKATLAPPAFRSRSEYGGYTIDEHSDVYTYKFWGFGVRCPGSGMHGREFHGLAMFLYRFGVSAYACVRACEHFSADRVLRLGSVKMHSVLTESRSAPVHWKTWQAKHVTKEQGENSKCQDSVKFFVGSTMTRCFSALK